MTRLARIGLALTFALTSAGCTLGMASWAATDVGTGELLGDRAAPAGGREIVFRLEGGEFRAIRVPDEWCGDPVRVRDVPGGTILEREPLLAGGRIEAPPPDPEKKAFARVYSLDYRATLRETLKTVANDKVPFDHTAASSAGPPSYFAVVRFLGDDNHVLHVLFGYDPKRFRWVRLSEPVDLGPASNHMGWGVALFPLCLAVDCITLAADLALGIASSGIGGGIFTAVGYAISREVFRIAPSDQLAPVRRPEVFRPIAGPD